MNLKEAYKELGLAQGATQEEAKKQFKKLAKEHHPDINKDPGAEQKFKKINEAYQCVQSGKGSDQEHFYPKNNHNPFGREQFVQAEHIELQASISFKEAVLGCKRDIKFNRTAKCSNCHGNGEISINNGCTACGGRGQSVVKNGNSIFIQSCTKCMGQSPTTPCSICNMSGIVNTEASVNVSIPGGVINGNILRLSGMGNYIGSFMSFDQSTDVHLKINVNPDTELSINGNDVVSSIKISLLEALSGCNKNIKTINGNKEIDIKPLSKHRDEILIPKLGVNGTGNQKVILDVQYPEDISNIINVLNERT